MRHPASSEFPPFSIGHSSRRAQALLLAVALISPIMMTSVTAAKASPGKSTRSENQDIKELMQFKIEVPPSQGDAAASNQAGPAGSESKDPEKAARQTHEVRTDAASVPPGSLRTVTARLSGSLCPVCLKTLSRKLETTRGIVKAKIAMPEKREEGSREPRFAPAEIVFDARSMDVKKIKRIIKSHDLFAWNIIEKSGN